MSWKGEVKTAGSDTWAGNALRFHTESEARSYINNLKMRWTAVTETRVVEVNEPATHRWQLEKPLPITT